MGFLNDAQRAAHFSRNYICNKCGGLMVFEDDMQDTLICTVCNHDIAYELYGFEDEDDYLALFPTEEEVTGIYEEPEELCEFYDEETDELSH